MTGEFSITPAEASAFLAANNRPRPPRTTAVQGYMEKLSKEAWQVTDDPATSLYEAAHRRAKLAGQAEEVTVDALNTVRTFAHSGDVPPELSAALRLLDDFGFFSLVDQVDECGDTPRSVHDNDTEETQT